MIVVFGYLIKIAYSIINNNNNLKLARMKILKNNFEYFLNTLKIDVVSLIKSPTQGMTSGYTRRLMGWTSALKDGRVFFLHVHAHKSGTAVRVGPNRPKWNWETCMNLFRDLRKMCTSSQICQHNFLFFFKQSNIV